MTQTVRVPNPVYERIKREAEQQDVQLGTVVRDWMEAKDELEQIELQR